MTLVRNALLAVAVILCASGASRAADFYADHQLVIDTCTPCHGLDYYVTPRSRKSWELTVANMRNYVWDERDNFTEEQARRVVGYMATYFGEDCQLDPAEHFTSAYPAETPMPEPATEAPPAEPVTEPVVTEVGAEPATPPAESASGEDVVSAEPPAETPGESILSSVAPPATRRADMPETIRERLDTPPWRPGPVLLGGAKVCGFTAVLCLFGLIGTGHNRRRLKARFRPVHACLALGLFLSLAGHGLIYLARYGGPPVLWYWFGVASFLLLVGAQLQGIVRKRFGRLFLRLHVCAGYTGLTVAVLHWVWAWL